MENARNRVTTKQQFEKLVELMEKNPETGRGKLQFGCSKIKSKELWEKFALELNSLGPPSRTAHEWGRVWVHYKANLKRKLANNRSNLLATGGGPSQEISLNSLEESVAQLVQIREQVAPTGRSFGVENTLLAITNEEMGDNFVAASSTPIEPQEVNPDVDRPTSSLRNRRKCQNVESERLEFLKMQTQTQKELLKRIEKLEKTTYKNYEINKKLLDIKQKKLEVFKMQAKEASELHALKVEVQKLKIEKLKNVNT